MRDKIILGAVVFVALGAMGLYIWNPFGDSGSGSDNFVSDNPNYLKLRAQVDTMGMNPWSPAVYQLTRANIQEYAGVTPKPLINEEEANSLLDYADKTCLGLLGDSVMQFCRYGEDMSQLNNLRNALNSFDSAKFPDLISPARTNIDAFYGAVGQLGAANSFIYGRYQQGRSDALQNSIKEFQSKPYLSENQALQKKLQESLVLLLDHSTIEADFNQQVLEDHCNCAVKYSRFRYYYRQCDSLQRAADNSNLNN